MTYTVEFLTAVNKVDIPRLDTAILANIKNAIGAKLLKHPATFGKPLRESLKGYRTLRVEHYRIVYIVEPHNNILIVAMRHRKDVYDVAKKRI